MKALKFAPFMGVLALIAMPHFALADDSSGDIEKQEPKLEAASKNADYEKRLMTRYNLTEDQLKSLHSAGMNDAQVTIAAQLAKASGKSIDDIEKMRIDQHMGWGKIAKELGVPPKDIGQAVADMHRSERAKKEDRDEKRDRAERQDREERRAARGEKHGRNG